jgi:sulfite reductase (NADPH) flavoprotein alpha-component
MVGPGTGIAPFRAFLHHRRAQGFTTPSWLFFGDRHVNCDFLYRSELEDFIRGRELTRLDLAFSRDQRDKIYVQQRMLESGRELWAWINDGATIYVCGDAERMAKDVDAALQQIIATHSRCSLAKAQLDFHPMNMPLCQKKTTCPPPSAVSVRPPDTAVRVPPVPSETVSGVSNGT